MIFSILIKLSCCFLFILQYSSSSFSPAAALATGAEGVNEIQYHCMDSTIQKSSQIKVAIAFFGMSRNLQLTLPSIKRHVFNILQQHQYHYDIFWYTTLTQIIYHPPKRESTDFIHSPEYIDPFQVRLLPSICKFSLINQDAVQEQYMEKFFHARQINATNRLYDQWGDNYHSMRNVMSSYHTQIKINEMISFHMKLNNFTYDIILAIRPDTAMIKDIDLMEHIEMIQKSQENDRRLLWVPDFQHWHGYNDRAAYGTPEAMALYLTRGIEFRDSLFHGNGETFLKLYTRNHSIKVMMSKMRMLRVRADGNIAYPDAYKPIQKYMSLHENDEDLIRCIDYKKQQLKADQC